MLGFDVRNGWAVLGLLLVSFFGIACGEEGGEAGAVPQADFAAIFEGEAVEIETQGTETRLTFQDIRYDFGTAFGLDPVSHPTLDKFAMVFATMPAARYMVVGHTDDRGDADGRVEESKQQAGAVASYLIGIVGGERLAFDSDGVGGAFPIATNATKNGRALNRRIEIIVEADPPGRTYRLTMAADVLDVIEDCDDFTGSPSAAAGDFFIQTEFAFFRSTRITNSPNVEVPANAGETIDLDIAAETLYWTSRSGSLDYRVDWSEADTEGPQFELSAGSDIRWSESDGCWLVNVGPPGGRCLSRTEGVIDSGTSIVAMPGTATQDACFVELDWSLTAERVQ